MIMHLDYEFNYEGQTYRGTGVDIGETINLKHEIETTTADELKIDAICHAFDLSIDEFEEKNYDLNDFQFNYCELREEE